ncbi:hypothetical protein HanRHA438_Chr16g0755731 [Helianthus annuus]|nr:hypothetical protein HanRHA438_Chr16g0755731 [Helianthus annuus]
MMISFKAWLYSRILSYFALGLNNCCFHKLCLVPDVLLNSVSPFFFKIQKFLHIQSRPNKHELANSVCQTHMIRDTRPPTSWKDGFSKMTSDVVTQLVDLVIKH